MGEVEHSVIFPGVKIGRNVRVVDSIIMEDCVLEDNVIVNKSILLTGVTVKANNVVGNGADIAVIDEGRVLSGSGYLN